MTSNVHGVPMLAWDMVTEACENSAARQLSSTCRIFRNHITTRFSEKFVPTRLFVQLIPGPTLPSSTLKSLIKFLGFIQLQHPQLMKSIENASACSSLESMHRFHSSWYTVDLSIDGHISEEHWIALEKLINEKVDASLLPRMQIDYREWRIADQLLGVARQCNISEVQSNIWVTISSPLEEEIAIAIKQGKSDVELIQLLTDCKKKGYTPSVRLLLGAIENGSSLEVVVTLAAIGGLGLTCEQLACLSVKKTPVDTDEINWLTHQLELFALRNPFNGASHMGNRSFWEEKPTMNHVLHLLKEKVSFEVVFHRLFKGNIKLSVDQIVDIMLLYQSEVNEKSYRCTNEFYYDEAIKIYFVM